MTYPHSLGYALFPLCLVYVGHKFKRCRAGQLCALGRGWIVEIDYIVGGVRLDRVDDVQLRESGLRRVRHARMVEDSTQVIPRGGVVRRERNLLLGEALTGDAVCEIDRALVANVIVSAPALTRQYSHLTPQKRGDKDSRKFTPHRLLRVLACPGLVPVLEREEEAMMPRRVVAHVISEESLDERQLVGPQVRLIKVGEQPLPVAPGVVVLCVYLEHLLVEC